MDIFIYSDESGVFDAKRYDFFVFGGLMLFSADEEEKATRLYQSAEDIVRIWDQLPDHCEAQGDRRFTPELG